MEPIQKVVENLRVDMEKIGLYMFDANVATNDEEAVAEEVEGSTKEDFRKKLAAGEASWLIQASFNVGDQAFTDRVLNPEKYEENKEFQTIMPTEVDLMRDKYADPEVQAALEAGDIDRYLELIGGFDESEDSLNP